MSIRFTTDSIRKRMKAMKNKLVASDSDENVSFRIDEWTETDGTNDSDVGNPEEKFTILNLRGGKRQRTSAQSPSPLGKATKTRGRPGLGNNLVVLSGNGPENNKPKGSGSNQGAINNQLPRGKITAKMLETVLESQTGEGSKRHSGTSTLASTPANALISMDPWRVFRRWPDSELKLQRNVIEKYEAGRRLWTQEQLHDIEEALDGGDRVQLKAYVGKSEDFEKQKGVVYKVEFHGYKELSMPPVNRPNGMPYCSMSLKAMPIDYSGSRNLSDEIEDFHKCVAIWLSNPIGQYFYSMFMRLPLPPFISRIVCFNLGSITAKPAEDYQHIRYAMYKHAAALTIVEALHKRFGHMIELYAQDTNYCQECGKVLFKKGFSVVGFHGAGGFAVINSSTLVFAPNADFCVKEIVADIVEPAAMFWNTVLTPDETEIATRSAQAVELNDELTSHY
ncbi:hypothetical protein F5Y04DRAFT_81979 [Hypomontagnella monticulosa]|nr:hypothetical protein F5Y04DRAFT_81979 [Hypomontagnella monticulosa]